MAGVLAVAGCKKSAPKPPPRQPGVVDISPLQQAFPNPSPEVQACIQKIRFAARYGTYEPALPELDKISNLPDLTEPQKKAINDVIDQVKEAIKIRTGATSQ